MLLRFSSHSGTGRFLARMDGIVGRLLREFSLTLTFAILVSTLVSLTVTPMICAHYIRQTTSGTATLFDRLIEGSLSRIVAFYARTLRTVLEFPLLTLLVFFATIALTVTLYIKVPKGYFPTDDSGFVIGATRASADISFQSMQLSRFWPLAAIARGYTVIFRGTPLILQMVFAYDALPHIGIKLPAVLAAGLALACNEAPFIAEMLRAGVLGVDRGQLTAGQALGMEWRQKTGSAETSQ